MLTPLWEENFSQPCRFEPDYRRTGNQSARARWNASKVFYEEESAHIEFSAQCTCKQCFCKQCTSKHCTCTCEQCTCKQPTKWDGSVWGGIPGDNPLDCRINTLDLLLLLWHVIPSSNKDTLIELHCNAVHDRAFLFEYTASLYSVFFVFLYFCLSTPHILVL